MVFEGCFKDLLLFHHHAQVDHLESVAAQHDACDVLADVVDIALDCGVDCHRSVGRIGFRFIHIRFEQAHGVFHHPGRFDHLGQEHLACTELGADLFHSGHQRAFNHTHGLAEGLETKHHVSLQVSGLAGDHIVAEPLLRRTCVAFRRRGRKLVFLGQIGCCQRREPFRSFRVAGQDHIFRCLAKGRVNGVVGLELGGIDDGHVESGTGGVVQENRVHRGPDGFVAPEGEREIRDAARRVGARQVLLDPAHGFDEIDAVAFVFGDTGSDGKHVHVEDDLFGSDAGFRQEPVGAFADSGLACVGCGLAFFVKGHHDHRGAQVSDLTGFFQETVRPFFQADGVDDALALGVLQSGQDAVPVG